MARDLGRLRRARDGVSVGNLSGAVGTFSAMGSMGESVQKLAMASLGLRAPEKPWHSSRDRWAEFAMAFVIAASTLGRIADEVMTLQKTEIGEVEEPRQATDVSSSAMPHRRNPIHSETLLSICNLTWEYGELVIRGMMVENERDDTSWGNQLIGLRSLCMAFSWMLERSRANVDGLVVNAEKMRKNLDAAGPSVYSEFLVAKMGEEVGSRKAHELLHSVFLAMAESGETSKDQFIRRMAASKMSASKLERWMNATEAVGSAVAITERTVRDLTPLIRKKRRV